jgi:ABC-type bacteriocin/lantibiotic exporter with double-glycine peptidase domain
VVFVLGLQRITPSLTAIGNGIVGLRSLQPRLALVLSAWQAPDRESASVVLSPQFTREIRLEQVSFSFDGAREVLHDISLTIRPGETLAIVGESGSGKSTLLDILVGLREPTRGRVSIDGISRDQICPSQWLGLFGVVSQEPFLFHLSVYENIRLGKLEASDEEIIQAARVANAHDFIQQMDHGYQTIVGERGALLSGGQRQRLTIARALLRKPAILVLDEATSSLDSLSEAEVRQAIAMIPNHITVILVAHRLSTVEGADRIVVLKDGQIVESGDHHSLMAEGKEYAALYRQSTVGNGSAEPL